MTMHKVLHLNNDRDRLYVGKKKGGREFANIDDYVTASIWDFNDYIKNAKKD